MHLVWGAFSAVFILYPTHSYCESAVRHISDFIVVLETVEGKHLWQELKYEHGKDETWKTWPTRQPLNDFTLSSAKHLITDIVNDFFNQLLPPFQPVKDKVAEYVRAAQHQFEELKDALAAYNRTTILGPEFVRYTFTLNIWIFNRLIYNTEFKKRPQDVEIWYKNNVCCTMCVQRCKDKAQGDLAMVNSGTK